MRDEDELDWSPMKHVAWPDAACPRNELDFVRFRMGLRVSKCLYLTPFALLPPYPIVCSPVLHDISPALAQFWPKLFVSNVIPIEKRRQLPLMTAFLIYISKHLNFEILGAATIEIVGWRADLLYMFAIHWQIRIDSFIRITKRHRLVFIRWVRCIRCESIRPSQSSRMRWTQSQCLQNVLIFHSDPMNPLFHCFWIATFHKSMQTTQKTLQYFLFGQIRVIFSTNA